MDLENLESRLSGMMGMAEKIPELATQLGIAYVGSMKERGVAGALTALIAFRLAQAQNLAAGIAGVGTLAWLGLSSLTPPTPPEGDEPYVPVVSEVEDFVETYIGQGEVNFPTIFWMEFIRNLLP